MTGTDALRMTGTSAKLVQLIHGERNGSQTWNSEL
jgi:hypothetical protein